MATKTIKAKGAILSFKRSYINLVKTIENCYINGGQALQLAYMNIAKIFKLNSVVGNGVKVYKVKKGNVYNVTSNNVSVGIGGCLLWQVEDEAFIDVDSSADMTSPLNGYIGLNPKYVIQSSNSNPQVINMDFMALYDYIVVDNRLDVTFKTYNANENILPTKLFFGYYLNGNGVWSGNGTWAGSYILCYNVQGLEKFKINGASRGANYSYAFFSDIPTEGTTTPLSYVKTSELDDNSEISVPSGAKYVLVNTTDGVEPFFKVS